MCSDTASHGTSSLHSVTGVFISIVYALDTLQHPYGIRSLTMNAYLQGWLLVAGQYVMVVVLWIGICEDGIVMLYTEGNNIRHFLLSTEDNKIDFPYVLMMNLMWLLVAGQHYFGSILIIWDIFLIGVCEDWIILLSTDGNNIRHFCCLLKIAFYVRIRLG